MDSRQSLPHSPFCVHDTTTDNYICGDLSLYKETKFRTCLHCLLNESVYIIDVCYCCIPTWQRITVLEHWVSQKRKSM